MPHDRIQGSAPAGREKGADGIGGIGGADGDFSRPSRARGGCGGWCHADRWFPVASLPPPPANISGPSGTGDADFLILDDDLRTQLDRANARESGGVDVGGHIRGEMTNE